MTTPPDAHGINQQTAKAPTVAEALAAAPSLDQAATKHPIGVPDDYLARRPPDVIGGTTGDMDRGYSANPPAALPPRYFEGDEMQPANMPPDQIAEKQRQLVSAGLLSEDDYHDEMGSWMGKSITAYSKLLQNANATGDNEDVALSKLQSAAAANPRPSTSKLPQPLVIHQTHPDDIRALANAVAVRTLGRRLSEDQLVAHVNAWQQTERQAQEDQYRMTGSGSPTNPGQGGTIIDPPKITDEQIRSENPQDAASYDAVGRFNQFEQLLRSHT